MKRLLKMMPSLLRIGFAENIAYRAEMLIWVLATTMPFVMMVMWRSVAEHFDIVGGMGQTLGPLQMTHYFLAVFVVRQVVSAWAAWEMNFEIRQGTLSMRLLKPISPLIGYAVSGLTGLPLRLVVALPVLLVFFFLGGFRPGAEYGLLFLLPLALVGGWLIVLFANMAIGSLAVFSGSSTRIMEAWMAAFFVFSGYLFPLDLFPDWLAWIGDILPFRYQLGFPVQVLTLSLEVGDALILLGKQWLWVAVLGVLTWVLWRRGVRHFEAFGG
ncbi:MAG: ABC-2 family transporter protein [Proteobacteria bacterium]|nr:ABC-2 family transporter protein [Cystobacterineae bacterium]MCL2258385.1 ABC-2 family transporter protein [Cystobacterineae bacterium]MCL2315103.1 ABC-2 family transporter protein [Pseudomonadota bacterium]